MKVGLFDHVSLSDRSLATTFDERLEFIQAADEAGFYCLHVAEHHCTPLNAIPVPGVFLGAVARLTKRMRFGPMVYLLPLYSPLRLAEEICMLDHLSNGRMESGVGRGVSPFELGYHKIAHEDSRDIFVDALGCLRAALASEVFSYESGRYSYQNVPMPMRPLQKPAPAFWYGSSNEIGSTFAGDEGMHFSSNGSTASAKANIAAYKQALSKRGGPAQPKAEFPGSVAIGISRQIVVADTDDEAHRIAKPACEYHLDMLNWLRKKHGSTEFSNRLRVPGGATYQDTLATGMVIAGSPRTVVAELRKQHADLGVNYLLAYLFFGTMTMSDAMRSLRLFTSEVMPEIDRL